MRKIEDYSIKIIVVLEILMLIHVMNIHFVQDGTFKTLKFIQVCYCICVFHR